MVDGWWERAGGTYGGGRRVDGARRLGRVDTGESGVWGAPCVGVGRGLAVGAVRAQGRVGMRSWGPERMGAAWGAWTVSRTCGDHVCTRWWGPGASKRVGRVGEARHPGAWMGRDACVVGETCVVGGVVVVVGDGPRHHCDACDVSPLAPRGP